MSDEKAAEGESPAFQYNEETARKGIKILAGNADHLEQLAQTLKEVVHKLHPATVGQALKFEVKESEDPDITYVTKGDEVVSTVTTSKVAYDKLGEIGGRVAEHIIQAIESAGKLAHEVHMDHRELETQEMRTLEKLPEILERASLILQKHNDVQRADIESRDQCIDAARDVKLIKRLTAELGDAGLHVAQFNKNMVDRQSDLNTASEIEEDKSRKWAAGIEMLAQSHKNADELNPAFRKRLEHEKSRKQEFEDEIRKKDPTFTTAILTEGEVETDRQKAR